MTIVNSMSMSMMQLMRNMMKTLGLVNARLDKLETRNTGANPKQNKLMDQKYLCIAACHANGILNINHESF